MNFFTTTSCTYILQNMKVTVQRSGSLQKFRHGKIKLAVEFETNNNEQVMFVCDRLCITHSFSVTSANIAINNISLKTSVYLQPLLRNPPRKLPNSMKLRSR